MTARFDPIALEILWRRLISIVDEADSAVSRTLMLALPARCPFTNRAAPLSQAMSHTARVTTAPSGSSSTRRK